MFLNNRILYTRGTRSISWGALLSPLSSLTGLYTFACDRQGNGSPLFAQVQHGEDSPLAHCLFLAPERAIDSWALPELMDEIVSQLGARRVHSLIAEAEESHPVVKSLRQNGFTIYARQQVWKVAKPPDTNSEKSAWRPLLERDRFPANLLYRALVPGQTQQIEMPNTQLMDGYVYRQRGEIVAYAEVARGSHGIWVQPFVNLDAEPFEKPLADLVARLHPRSSRPVYICLRSYQDWLQGALEDLDADVGPQQVVMARRTTLPLPVAEAHRAAVPSRGAEPSTSMHVPQPEARYEPERMNYDQTPNYR